MMDKQLAFTIWILLASCILLAGVPSFAGELQQETLRLDDEESIPLYLWNCSDSSSPRAVVVAVHGMTLHGRRFDQLARELAGDNVVVVSTDLRGFGARQNLPANPEGRTPVHYRRSESELIALCRQMKKRYPNTPLFVVGESLGANLAIDIAATEATLVDGVIACSPCVRRVMQVSPHMVADIARGICHPYRRISLRTYVAAKLSEDPRVVRDYLDDPLIRCDLTFAELLKSLGANKRSLPSVSMLPSQLPVLIIAGERDRIYSSRSLRKFVSTSSSTKTELSIEKGRGHLLVEHAFIDRELIAKIRGWLNASCQHLQEARNNTLTTN